LDQAQEGLSLHVAVEKTLSLLTENERRLLDRLSAFETPVIEDGVQALCLDLEEWRPDLDRLTDLSLVEPSKDTFLNRIQFIVSPFISEWLAKNSEAIPLDVLNQSAAYQEYVLGHLRPTIEQAMVAHRAWNKAENRDLACDLVQKVIYKYFYVKALYRTLAEEWLPPLLETMPLSN